MSTKSSLFYNNDKDEFIHVYKDLVEPESLFIQKKVNQELTLELSPLEAGIIAKCFDLDELNRQSNLTDEQIQYHAKNVILKCNDANSFSSFWLLGIIGDAESEEEKIERLFNHYIHVRNKIRELNAKISNSRIYKIDFGLENIK